VLMASTFYFLQLKLCFILIFNLTKKPIFKVLSFSAKENNFIYPRTKTIINKVIFFK